MVKEVMPTIWTWSWFAEHKGFFFNGTAVLSEDSKVLIDPVWMNPEKEAVLSKLGPFDAIYLTNKDHERAAFDLRKKWGLPIGIHENDAPLMKEAPDFTFTDGEVLHCGLEVIHLEHQKSPGESALYLGVRKLLIVGDSLIGHPKGNLRLLPVEKYLDVSRAQSALMKLKNYEVESIIVGDGAHIFDEAKGLLAQTLDHFEKMSMLVEKG